MPKKLKGGGLGIFQHPFRRKTRETIWGYFFRKKMSNNAEKSQRRDPLVSPGNVCM